MGLCLYMSPVSHMKIGQEPVSMKTSVSQRNGNQFHESLETVCGLHKWFLSYLSCNLINNPIKTITIFVPDWRLLHGNLFLDLVFEGLGKSCQPLEKWPFWPLNVLFCVLYPSWFPSKWYCQDSFVTFPRGVYLILKPVAQFNVKRSWFGIRLYISVPVHSPTGQFRTIWIPDVLY